MPAAGAFVEVTAESGGATPRNGPQHFDMLPADPPSASIDEDVSRSADEIGNFEDGPIHLLVLQYQLVELGHGNLPVTHTYTSNEGTQCSVRPTRSVRRRAATLCAGHVQQPGGASPLPNLMEVKG